MSKENFDSNDCINTRYTKKDSATADSQVITGDMGASLVVQLVKNLPAVQKTQVRCLGWEDPLEKEIATHSSMLAWKISWTEEPGGLQSMGLQRVGHN